MLLLLSFFFFFTGLSSLIPSQFVNPPLFSFPFTTTSTTASLIAFIDFTRISQTRGGKKNSGVVARCTRWKKKKKKSRAAPDAARCRAAGSIAIRIAGRACALAPRYHGDASTAHARCSIPRSFFLAFFFLRCRKLFLPLASCFFSPLPLFPSCHLTRVPGFFPFSL